MDAGVIKNLKYNCKKNVINKMIHSYDTNPSEKFNLSVLDALVNVNNFWEAVKMETI